MEATMVDSMGSVMNDVMASSMAGVHGRHHGRRHGIAHERRHGLFKNVEHCIIGAIPAMFSIIGSAVALVTAVVRQPV